MIVMLPENRTVLEPCTLPKMNYQVDHISEYRNNIGLPFQGFKRVCKKCSFFKRAFTLANTQERPAKNSTRKQTGPEHSCIDE